MTRYIQYVVLSGAVLTQVAFAGIQVPLLVINMSPFPAEVDFTVGEFCMKHDFDPSELQHYFSSWESTNLGNDFGQDFASYNDYLQQFKTQLGVPTLSSNEAPMTGVQNIPGFNYSSDGSAPSVSSYSVFVAKVDAGLFSGCKDRESWQSFAITVDGETEYFTLADPATSQWTLDMTDPDDTPVVIGSGGHADWLPITMDAITVIAAVLTFGYAASAAIAEGAIVTDSVALSAMTDTQFYANYALKTAVQAAVRKAFFTAGGATFSGIMDVLVSADKDDKDPLEAEERDMLMKELDLLAMNYTAIYDSIDVDNRQACVMGKNWWGIFECLVAGAAIIIQGNGKAVAMPLPNVYRAWD